MESNEPSVRRERIASHRMTRWDKSCCHRNVKKLELLTQKKKQEQTVLMFHASMAVKYFLHSFASWQLFLGLTIATFPPIAPVQRFSMRALVARKGSLKAKQGQTGRAHS